jgi:hypothetical protein
MSPIPIFQQIQDMALSRLISQSTWGYPIVGAVHVLGMALFGGAVLVSNLSSIEDAMQVRTWKRIGFVVVMATGSLLFASNAVRYACSRFFEVKMILLVLLAMNALCFARTRRRAYISLGLWGALIFASRGIAIF